MLRAAQYFHHRGTVRPGAIAFGVRSIRVSRHGQTLNRQDAKAPRKPGIRQGSGCAENRVTGFGHQSLGVLAIRSDIKPVCSAICWPMAGADPVAGQGNSKSDSPVACACGIEIDIKW
jgi:hypothetical protein